MNESHEVQNQAQGAQSSPTSPIRGSAVRKVLFDARRRQSREQGVVTLEEAREQQQTMKSKPAADAEVIIPDGLPVEMVTRLLRGGAEHLVALADDGMRVLKALDSQKLATDSIFDYLTDIILSNHFFGDEMEMQGCIEYEGGVRIITTQPFIKGVHPTWDELVRELEQQGLRHASPRSKIPSFVIDDEIAGEIDVIDLHENNVVRGSVTGLLHPIDAHFYFADRALREAALQKLNLYP